MTPQEKGKAASREQARFNQAIGWIRHLDKPAQACGKESSSAAEVYNSAFNVLGLMFVTRLINQAKAGDADAVRKVVVHCCEMAEAIEEVAEKRSGMLKELAARRPDWPVMLCRHETSAKPVAAYLDKIGLGSK